MNDDTSETDPFGIEMPGDSLIADRYQLVRLIAKGGMAEVHLARQVGLNRDVALKILKPPPDADDPESFEERFKLEAETLAGLNHPNIVTLHDFGETRDGRFFLAMELVDGPRLTDLLKDGPLPAERAIRLLLQVCAAVRYAHKRGCIHRDLKPSNLLIRHGEDGQEQVKVVDFGLVKLTEGDQSITRHGLILGSPHCMAPEQVKGTNIDHRADIYAIGVLLFRAVTGHYPFHGSSSTATMIAHLNQPVPTFAQVAPHVPIPSGLEPIVQRCLQKTPADRYDDVQTLITALGALLQGPVDPYLTMSMPSASMSRSLVMQTQQTRAVGSYVVAAGVGVGTGLLALALAIGGVLLYAMFGGTQTTVVEAPRAPLGTVESRVVADPLPPEAPLNPATEAPPGEAEPVASGTTRPRGSGGAPATSGATPSGSPTKAPDPVFMSRSDDRPAGADDATGTATKPPSNAGAETKVEPKAKPDAPPADAPAGYMDVPDDW